jgi:hypothetical protein
MLETYGGNKKVKVSTTDHLTPNVALRAEGVKNVQPSFYFSIFC